VGARDGRLDWRRPVGENNDNNNNSFLIQECLQYNRIKAILVSFEVRSVVIFVHKWLDRRCLVGELLLNIFNIIGYIRIVSLTEMTTNTSSMLVLGVNEY